MEDGIESPGGEKGIVVGIALVLVLAGFANLALTLNIILVKNAAPNQQTLGAIYGLSQTCAGVGRSISPAFVSSLFAWSIEKKFLGGNLVWVVMTGLAVIGARISMGVIDGSEVPTNSKEDELE